MAVQAQFGGGLAGCLAPFGGGLGDEQLQALLLSAAAAAGSRKAYLLQPHHHTSCAQPVPGVASAAQSELTCNGGAAAAAAASRKRGREDQYVSSPYPSSAALLPIPGMQQQRHDVAHRAVASTSGRAAEASELSELLRRQELEVDAVVRSECERLRLGLERASKRQREAAARFAASAASRALREKEAALGVARRRAAELEERLRQACAESQAWCGLARSHEAVASGLRATLDALLLRGSTGAGAAAQPAEAGEGFGDSGGPGPGPAEADDAESCCFVEEEQAAASTACSGRWTCRACGAGEASVLVLPCRHLCLCKACEPRADACPVCLAAKNASIHVAAATD